MYHNCMIFITGDTHGGQAQGYDKLLNHKLNADDKLVVVGDFGYSFYSPGMKAYNEHKKWSSWLEEQPFTTFFIDGNHENFEALALLPEIDLLGGRVGKASDKLFHLKRGQIYTIEGKTFFTFGGAISPDKNNRTPGVDWFPQEEPNFMEYKNGLDTLDKAGNKVDYILTHEAGTTIRASLTRHDPYHLCSFIDMVLNTTEFTHHYFGHHHRDQTFGKSTCLYRSIIELPSVLDTPAN